ncbi:MAG: hypothetical protein ABMB14_37485 [Myxococcota bacterium]
MIARGAVERRSYVRTGAPIYIRVVQDDEARSVTECRLPAGIVLREEGPPYDGVRFYLLHLVSETDPPPLSPASIEDQTSFTFQATTDEGSTEYER